MTRRLVDIEPLEEWKCHQGDHHRTCSWCDRGVVIPAGVRRDVDAKVYERFVQAVAGVIRIADGFDVPTPAQERKWRSAFASASGPLVEIAAAATTVLDAVTRGVDDRRPLDVGELTALNVELVARDPSVLMFGAATEWWPLDMLDTARKAWLSALSPGAMLRDRIIEARLDRARRNALGALQGPKQGEPAAALHPMLDQWEATVTARVAETGPERVVTLKRSVNDLDLTVRWLIVTYQAAVETVDDRVFRAVLYVPYVVRRWLFQRTSIRRGLADLGAWAPGDDQATAELALGVRGDVGVDQALDAARMLRVAAPSPGPTGDRER